VTLFYGLITKRTKQLSEENYFEEIKAPKFHGGELFFAFIQRTEPESLRIVSMHFTSLPQPEIP
jgi:hypothetical protein